MAKESSGITLERNVAELVSISRERFSGVFWMRREKAEGGGFWIFVGRISSAGVGENWDTGEERKWQCRWSWFESRRIEGYRLKVTSIVNLYIEEILFLFIIDK